MSILSNIEFTSYTDDNTSYVIGRNAKEEANPDRFHLLTSWNDELKIYINDDVINGTKCEKLLGVMTENKLISNTHIKVIKPDKNFLHYPQ